MWNAGDKPFNQINFSSVPNMAVTLTSWFQSLTFNVVTKEVINFETVETTKDVTFKGVWQPLSPEKIKLKPETQWSWKWVQVHAQTLLSLKIDDVVKYRDNQYRVNACLDYNEYGYFEYHLVQDFTGSGPIIVPEVPVGTP